MFHRRSTGWTVAAIGMLLASQALISIQAVEDTEKVRIGFVDKTEGHPFEFEVVGLPPALLKQLSILESADPIFAQTFTVTVAGKESDKSIPPVSGRYRVDGKRLVFVPRFPPQPGLTYRALFHDDSAKAADQAKRTIQRDIAIPKPEKDANRAATQVRHVFPTSDVLPENHLRFYIYFSQPMARAAAYQNLELLDGTGQPLESSFLELGEELWDPSGTRFTLLFDPGRIKRGLKPREELGPVLEDGKHYTLVIKREWRDARGELLKSDFRKSFKVGPPLDKPLDTADWKLNAPATGTKDLFVVKFPRPLDYALTTRVLSVIDPAGHTIDGQSIVCNSELQWTFMPQANWQLGRHQLVIDTVLEDPSGNRIGRAFEVDEQETVTQKVVSEFVKLPFEVKSKDTAAIVP